MCRGLFEQHKLLYAFTIAVMMGIDRKDIKRPWWTAFLVGVPKCDRDDEPCPKPQPWLSDALWRDVLRLSCIEDLEGFSDSFLKDLAYVVAVLVVAAVIVVVVVVVVVVVIIVVIIVVVAGLSEVQR